MISERRTTVSPAIRLTGGFAKVTFAICGDTRSGWMVLCSFSLLLSRVG
jgi:hypothetical protein